jgi:hypothetical protein
MSVVQEAMLPGITISYVARRHGIAPSLIFGWRRRMSEGGKEAIKADDEVVVTLPLISGQFEIGLSCLLRPSTTGAAGYEGQAFYRGADYLRCAKLREAHRWRMYAGSWV